MVTIFPRQFSSENGGETLVSCPGLLPASRSGGGRRFFATGAVLGALGRARGGEVGNLRHLRFLGWEAREEISVVLLRNESKGRVIFTTKFI